MPWAIAEYFKNQVVLEPAMQTRPLAFCFQHWKFTNKTQSAYARSPSDHWIEDEKAFKRMSKPLLGLCIAIDPDDFRHSPHFSNTGYGCIESDNAVGESIKPVKQFCEKPNYEKAKAFLAAGNFSWNAGILFGALKASLMHFKNWMPEMYGLFVKGDGCV